MRQTLVYAAILSSVLSACDNKQTSSEAITPAPEAATTTAPLVAEAMQAAEAVAQAKPAEQTASSTNTAPIQDVATPGTAALDLARKSGCLACHSIEKKVVGPAWKDVAARYKGQADAKQQLLDKVKKGGKGNWTDVTGGAPMPPYSPRVTDTDIETLVDFVLSL